MFTAESYSKPLGHAMNNFDLAGMKRIENEMQLRVMLIVLALPALCVIIAMAKILVAVKPHKTNPL